MPDIMVGGNLTIVMALAMEMDKVASIDLAELAAGFLKGVKSRARN